MKKYSSQFVYYRDLVPSDELTTCVKNLQDVGIDLKLHDETGIPKAFLEHFTNVIYLKIPPELIGEIKTALITSVCYDTLKSTIIFLWKQTKGKKLTKYFSDGDSKEIEATFGINVELNDFTKFDIRLSGDISDEDKGRVIDKAFEFVSNQETNKIPNSDFLKFNAVRDEWEKVNVVEEIKKLRQLQSDK